MFEDVEVLKIYNWGGGGLTYHQRKDSPDCLAKDFLCVQYLNFEEELKNC